MWSCRRWTPGCGHVRRRWTPGCGHVEGGHMGVVMQGTDLGSTEIYRAYIHMYLYTYIDM